jgi:hypothetical protein
VCDAAKRPFAQAVVPIGTGDDKITGVLFQPGPDIGDIVASRRHRQWNFGYSVCREPIRDVLNSALRDLNLEFIGDLQNRDMLCQCQQGQGVDGSAPSFPGVLPRNNNAFEWDLAAGVWHH